MLRASRLEARNDALTGPAQPPRAACRPRATRSPRPTSASRRARALRPRRLQALQRLLRPPGRRRAAACAWAARSRATSAATARAYRMGGDEFCALLRPGAAADRAARRRRRRARSPSTARASRSTARTGSVVAAARRRATPTEALRIADQRMYAQKRGGRTSAGRQTTRRAAARARRAPPRPRRPRRRRRRSWPRRPRAASASPTRSSTRSATPPSCTTSARSRSPTRSSTSPARSTTTSGRSCAATRSSASASSPRRPRWRASPRSSAPSHERWDGAGYPDGLAGEDIPLGARIIAVCDAFDAMITDRPTAAPRRREAALARAAPLRRHASSTPSWSRRSAPAAAPWRTCAPSRRPRRPPSRGPRADHTEILCF